MNLLVNVFQIQLLSFTRKDLKKNHYTACSSFDCVGFLHTGFLPQFKVGQVPAGINVSVNGC